MGAPHSRHASLGAGGSGEAAEAASGWLAAAGAGAAGAAAAAVGQRGGDDLEAALAQQKKELDEDYMAMVGWFFGRFFIALWRALDTHGRCSCQA